MTARDVVTAAVSAVLADSAEVRLTDLPAEQAAYLRRLGAARGLATDAEVEAALSERPADKSDLDEIAARARRR